MKRIFTARDALEAHFVLGLLAEAGVEAIIENELLQQIRGDVPMTMETLPKIAIRDADEPAALKVIDEFRARKLNPAPAAGTPWTCACGEMHAPQFTTCWRCSATRPTQAYADRPGGTLEG